MSIYKDRVGKYYEHEFYDQKVEENLIAEAKRLKIENKSGFNYLTAIENH